MIHPYQAYGLHADINLDDYYIINRQYRLKTLLITAYSIISATLSGKALRHDFICITT